MFKVFVGGLFLLVVLFGFSVANTKSVEREQACGVLVKKYQNSLTTTSKYKTSETYYLGLNGDSGYFTQAVGVVAYEDSVVGQKYCFNGDVIDDGGFTRTVIIGMCLLLWAFVFPAYTLAT